MVGHTVVSWVSLLVICKSQIEDVDWFLMSRLGMLRLENTNWPDRQANESSKITAADSRSVGEVEDGW